MKGSSLRDLHNAVFDVIDGSVRSSTVRVGLGAGVYGFVGRWVPRSLVSWMMGIRRVDELKTWQYNTPRSAGSVDEENDEDEKDEQREKETGTSQESFVDVADSHVWKED